MSYRQQRMISLTLPGVAVTIPWDGTKPPVGGGGGGPPTSVGAGTVPAGSGDGWYRGGCGGDEKLTGNDDSGMGAVGTDDAASGIGLYVRSGMPSTPTATGGTAGG